ncbi:zf-HC2 domain-containing protein [Micromonospora sp. NPDC047548]|uniref:zf-HC2 domain-containing protein n=1 Tax=Micromonospora sp. NPDC047548 TaxID=3155624 RepID=UPI0033D26039
MGAFTSAGNAVKDITRDDSIHRVAAQYLLGALDPAAEAAFEQHLGGCPTCQWECDALGPLVSGLSLLPDAEVAALLTADPAVGQPATVSVSRQHGRPPAPTRRRDGAADIARRGPARAEAPIDAEGTDRPRRTRRPGRLRRLAMGGIAVLIALAVGTAVGRAIRPAESTQLTPVDSSVTVEGTAAAARLSVVIAAKGHSTTITATVTGLEPSERYRLYAVTTDGHAHEVDEWTGSVGATDLTTELELSVADLAFFSVTRQDGTAVVAARLS